MDSVFSSYNRELLRKLEWPVLYAAQVLACEALSPKRSTQALQWWRTMNRAVRAGELVYITQTGKEGRRFVPTSWAALSLTDQAEFRQKFGTGWQERAVVLGFGKFEPVPGKTEAFVNPHALLAWLRARGDTFNASRLAEVMRTAETPIDVEPQAPLRKTMDLSNLDARDLQALSDAAAFARAQWWGTWEPGLPKPNARGIEEWLFDKCGASRPVARKIQTLSRPPEHRKGGRPRKESVSEPNKSGKATKT